MADGVWSRQGVPFYSSSSSAALLKRPRTEYDPQSSGLAGSGQEMRNYTAQNDNQGGLRVVRDTDAIGSAYDRYLQAAQASSYAPEDTSNLAASGLRRAMVGAVSGMPRPVGSDLLQNGQGVRVGGQHPVDTVSRHGHGTISLPHDASKTLYIEGLPSDITRREVAHIFRPFVGYKEVRLVSKDSKHRGDPIILCFVDFADPACAATAMTALQGYEIDEHNQDSSVLRIQFSRYPGPRSNAGPRRHVAGGRQYS